MSEINYKGSMWRYQMEKGFRWWEVERAGLKMVVQVWIGWTSGLFARCLCPYSAEHSTAYQAVHLARPVSHLALISRLSFACQDCLTANCCFLPCFWEFNFMCVPSVPFRNFGGKWAALWIRLASRVEERRKTCMKCEVKHIFFRVCGVNMPSWYKGCYFLLNDFMRDSRHLQRGGVWGIRWKWKWD